jgi:DNA-binding LacI/PurR family transcriptional regulator
VGWDDIEDGRFATPSLTTISPDKQWIARTALDRVMHRLSDPAPPAHVFVAPHRLIVRESSPAR